MEDAPGAGSERYNVIDRNHSVVSAIVHNACVLVTSANGISYLRIRVKIRVVLDVL